VWRAGRRGVDPHGGAAPGARVTGRHGPVPAAPTAVSPQPLALASSRCTSDGACVEPPVHPAERQAEHGPVVRESACDRLPSATRLRAHSAARPGPDGRRWPGDITRLRHRVRRHWRHRGQHAARPGAAGRHDFALVDVQPSTRRRLAPMRRRPDEPTEPNRWLALSSRRPRSGVRDRRPGASALTNSRAPSATDNLRRLP
jgi:hypothetical protein